MSELIEKVTANVERPVKLSALVSGDTFRFSYMDYATAMNEKAFFVVAEAPEEASKKKVGIFNPATGEYLIRDNTHRVVKHESEFAVKRNI